jgi:hypothetical protein
MPAEDPLKALSEIGRPDVRRANIVGNLSDEHQDLASIRLNDTVPDIAAQLFETAKNVSLYSWFVYRFHPVAESVAYAALEMSLNLRKTGLRLLPPSFRSVGLSKLLREAFDSGALSEAGLPSRPALVAHAARFTMIARLIAEGRDGAEVPDPTEEDVALASSQVSISKDLIELWPQVRNTLAHGSPRLTPNSRQTLRLIAEAINQLFP